MRKYIIDNEEYIDTSKAAEYLAEQIDEDGYDDMLDDAYGTVSICGYEYDSSYALHQLDEIAYRCGFSDYTDSIQSDIEYDLENMDDGEECEIYNCTVICEDNEGEDDEESE